MFWQLGQLLLDAEYLFKAFARKSREVARDEIQICSLCVWYLGHDISAAGKMITDWASAIQHFSLPEREGQRTGFWGLVVYCRLWIPNSLWLPYPSMLWLGRHPPDPVVRDPLSKDAFKNLKGSLLLPPTLELSNDSLSFSLFVHEWEGHALSVILEA